MSNDQARNRSSIPVTVTAYTTVVVHDPEPFERVVGPEGDEWRSQFYDFWTVEDVAEHLAFNAVTNGITDISRLEGWADCPSQAVVVLVDDVDCAAEDA